jgi:hypothetical protein
MVESYFRQTDEFHVVDLQTGVIETVFEYTQVQATRPRPAADTGDAAPRTYNLRRGAVRLVPSADGTFSTADGARRFRRT